MTIGTVDSDSHICVFWIQYTLQPRAISSNDFVAGAGGSDVSTPRTRKAPGCGGGALRRDKAGGISSPGEPLVRRACGVAPDVEQLRGGALLVAARGPRIHDGFTHLGTSVERCN